MDEDQVTRLLAAAKTALVLMESIHATLWQLFPEEILTITQDDERRVAKSIATALLDNNRSSAP